MIPKTKSQEEVFSKILDERTKDLNTKLDEISLKMTSKPKEEKIEEIIKKMKDKIPERISERLNKGIDVNKVDEKKDELKKVDEVPKEPEHVHDDVFCPSCQKGHIHKMENSGLKLKCTGKDCGEEYVVVPMSADYTCTNCGLPIKKDEKMEACPFCNNKKAVPFSNGKPELKFDFSKMKK